MNAVVELTL